MRSDLWGQCSRLGRVLLPLLDQEAGCRERRHEHFRIWGMDAGEGERLLEILAALIAFDATAADGDLGSVPLRRVADHATATTDIELLARLPASPAPFDERTAALLRRWAYRDDDGSRKLFRLLREVRYTLLTLARGNQPAAVTCGDLLTRAGVSSPHPPGEPPPMPSGL